MIKKFLEKKEAIKLRYEGFSYSEILEKIPVAKSTLSLWLKEIGLSKAQKQRLTDKKLASMKRGWEAVHQKRVVLVEKIKKAAEKEIGKISKRELFLIGVALYWAEGSKDKDYKPGREVCFSNSDPKMILLFLKWLKEVCLIPKSSLVFELYIHETADINKSIIFWEKLVDCKKQEIRVYLKRHKINTKRKNINSNYIGLLRIKVKKSSILNRKIAGWVDGICDNY